MAAYILGEFGSLISEDRDSTPMLQFQALHNLWPFVSNSTRAVLLNSYGKFSFLYGADRQLVANIQSVFQYYSASLDEEIQQRAAEYNGLLRLPNQAILEKTWDPMPAFKDDDALSPATAEAYEPPIVDLQGMGSFNAGGNNNNYYPPQQPAQQQQLQQELQQRLAAGPVAASAAPGGIVEPTPELLATHDGLYRQLWLNSEGFLYRDDRVQVGVRSQMQAGVFHLMLYFGNSSGVELSNFVVVVPTVDYLQIVTKPIPSVIAAGQQASQLLSIGCVREFVPSPVLQVSFSCRGQAFHIPLKLPVVLTKYVMGASLTAAQFFGTWKQFEPNLEHQAVIKTTPLLVSKVSMADIVRKYGFAVLEDVDPNVNNVVAAGTFVTVTGENISIVVRLEGNPQVNMTRVSVRAANLNVATTIGKFIAVQLQE